MNEKDKTIESMRFEEAMQALESIVASLEGDTVMLDDAVRCYEQGVRLLRHCEHKLAQAKSRIEKVRLDEGTAQGLEPFKVKD